MIDTNFVHTFIAADPKHLSQEEIDQFNIKMGYSESLTNKEKVQLYEEFHAIYDIEMDEMDEEENIKVTPTYILLTQHMANNW